MTKEKAKIGDIRPVFQQVGWEVCEKASDKPEDEIWITTDKQSEAKIMSYQFKQTALQEE